ncbi:MAG: YebC/PmpR family DNA-binding transcriptional regulator [Candidatus Levyibacteriota bacterium]
MSGHSKWATIKRQKGIADIKKGQIFTKLAKAIIIAVKQSGGLTDPSQNFKLRLAMDKAQEANMPKENIARAIERAKGIKEGELSEIIYEGFAPHGVSVMVEAVTDNSQRTAAEVKNIFNKAGGSFGQPGSVAYQFSQMGRVTVKKDGKSLEDIFLLAADSGAEDIDEDNDEVVILTPADKLAAVRSKLAGSGLNIVEAALIRLPINPVFVENPESVAKVNSFIETLESLDDVQKVYSNLNYENQ